VTQARSARPSPWHRAESGPRRSEKSGVPSIIDGSAILTITKYSSTYPDPDVVRIFRLQVCQVRLQGCNQSLEVFLLLYNLLPQEQQWSQLPCRVPAVLVPSAQCSHALAHDSGAAFPWPPPICM
jgi:hypothetical protein